MANNQNQKPFAGAQLSAAGMARPEVESPVGAPDVSATGLSALAEAMRNVGGTNAAETANAAGAYDPYRFDELSQIPGQEPRGFKNLDDINQLNTAAQPEEISPEQQALNEDLKNQQAAIEPEGATELYSEAIERETREIAYYRQQLLSKAAEAKGVRNKPSVATIRTSSETTQVGTGVRGYLFRLRIIVQESVNRAKSSKQWAEKMNAKKRQIARGAGHGKGLSEAKGGAEITSELINMATEETWLNNVNE